MSLPIFAEDVCVAVVDADRDGVSLRYADAWRASAAAFPVSLTMPLAAAEFGPEIVTPWLMNLLPEGDPLRAMTRALGVARDDVLGLIAETGGDLAGALTIGAPRAASPAISSGRRAAREASAPER